MSAPTPSLVAVTAHPGDEVFNFGATLAEYAARGARVTVVCATRGETTQDPSGEVAARREAELRRACEALRLDEPRFLGFHDSGGSARTNRDEPRALVNADPADVEGRLREHFAQLAPDVILTLDARGGNSHPDKRVVHQATAAAFHFSAALLHRPRRLFVVARSLPFMERLCALPSGPWRGLDPRLYATPDEGIAARIDTRARRGAVILAARAHASQPLSRLSDELLDDVYGPSLDEGTFALAGSTAPFPSWPLTDLFAGL